MPRRRRKYRPPQQEQEKPAPFFAGSHGEAPLAASLQSSQAQVVQYKAVEEAKTAALHQLKTVKSAIRSSQPDQALVQQSKALELANRMIAADVWDIGLLQEILAKICRTLAESRFICGPVITRSYGQTQAVIQLGHSFKQLGPEDQVRVLLREAVQATGLPELYGLPTSDYENTDRPDTWVEYLYRLLQLLPERPYLITGTPTNDMPPMPLPEEEDEAPEDEVTNEVVLPDPIARTLSAGESGVNLPATLPEPEARANTPTPLEVLPEEETTTLPAIPPTPNSNIFRRVRNWFSRKK